MRVCHLTLELSNPSPINDVTHMRSHPNLWVHILSFLHHRSKRHIIQVTRRHMHSPTDELKDEISANS